MISTGTEKLVALGLVPADMQLQLKVPYMDGYLGLPVKFGYSLVGEIIEGPAEIQGKKVHLMHPHQDYGFVDYKDICFIPDKLPLTRACLMSNMETALNALWDSGISPGDNVLICGFGMLGAITGSLASKIPGVNVFVHEINESRRKIAESLGFPDMVPEKGFDITINTSGTSEGLQMCIDKAVHGGVVTELSWYGNRNVSLKLGSSFHVGQKRIISSQASSIPLDRVHRCDKKRRRHIAMDLLLDDFYDKLPFHIVPFETLPDIFSQIRAGNYEPIITIVKYT